MNYIIYQVHGNIDFYNEALFSILSYYKHNKESKNSIVIYTENEQFFKNILPSEVVYINITPEKIKEWRGKINFVHLVKIKIIQDIASRYNGNFLYLDTDTFFTSNINNIFDSIENEGLFLDKYECNLFETKNGITKPIISFFKKNKIQKSNSDFGDIEIKKPFDTWNAGVIGFNSKYTYLLKDIEEFTNLFYPKIKSHITEQLAFCYYFNKIKTPQVTDESIFHYWDFKSFRSILEEFFYFNKSKNLIELIAEIDKINPKLLSKEKIDYRKKTFLKKIIHRILKGRKWKIAPYKL